MRRSTVALVLFALGFIVRCQRLPSNFARLPPKEKISAYANYLANGGHPTYSARHAIADDCGAAENIIATELLSSAPSIDREELLMLLNTMQARGCELNETEAERALEIVLVDRRFDATQREIAKSTLAAIKANYRPPTRQR